MQHDSTDAYEWLISPQAEGALACAAELVEAKTNLVRCVQLLRKNLSPVQAKLVLETVELRQRAREKFARSEYMFFTRTGLEQATDEQTASYKAARIPTGCLIADWCTGIGGDLSAWAQRGEWVGADSDPVMQLLAAHNVSITRKLDYQSAKKRMRCEISAHDIPPEGRWHLDPDRRDQGKRTVHLESFSPPLEFIEQLRKERPHGALKIAPASCVPEHWSPEVQREWISRNGECRQQVAWFGEMAAQPGEHVATVLRPTAAEAFSVRGLPTHELPVAAQLGRYLHEPDPAVIAAGLTATLSQQNNMAAIAAGSVYLTSDTLVMSPAVASFEILDQLPFDMKRLKSYFRDRQVGRLEIKKRGVEILPEQVRKQLALSGDQTATLFITRLGKQTVALVARRCQ